MIDLLTGSNVGLFPSRSICDIVKAAARRKAGGDLSDNNMIIRGITCSKYTWWNQ